MKPSILAIALFMGMTAHAAEPTKWTQQPGTVYWYKSGNVNKYPTTNPADFTIPPSWVKQTDKVYIQCKSTGGSNRYYEQGLDCYGKPVLTNNPPSDAIECAVEGQSCAVNGNATVWFGNGNDWIFKENVNSPITCNIESFGKDPIYGIQKKCAYKSSGIVNPPIPPIVTGCTAFMCKDDFGITFDLSQNTVLTCPRVQITKEQLALIYDATKVNNIPPCK